MSNTYDIDVKFDIATSGGLNKKEKRKEIKHNRKQFQIWVAKQLEHFDNAEYNMDDYYEGKAKETGISIHKRFKKKDLKPFIYYSRILLKPRPDMVDPYSLKHKEEYLCFGIMTEIKHFVLGTYITTQIEDLMNLNKESSQLSITLGALLY